MKEIDVQHPPSEAKVELYIKDDCPFCIQAMAFYDAAGVTYITHDAQRDRQAREAMFRLTNADPTVPAIVIDGVYIQSGWGSPPRG